jgi:hypothetical protein
MQYFEFNERLWKIYCFFKKKTKNLKKNFWKDNLNS